MEIWKDIPNYEGLYQVSNLGRIKSLDRKVIQWNKTEYVEHIYKGKILKQHISNNGYCRVILYKNRQPKNKLVHRLIAEVFIPNINNYQYVNHKDEDKTNNCVNNLEWCTQSYNINYGDRNNKVRSKLLNKPKSDEHKHKLSIKAKKRYQNCCNINEFGQFTWNKSS